MVEQEPYSVEWHKGFQMGLYSGVSNERERIIKLLEKDMEHALDENGKCVYEKHYPEACNCDVIALIKGENK